MLCHPYHCITEVFSDRNIQKYRNVFSVFIQKYRNVSVISYDIRHKNHSRGQPQRQAEVLVPRLSPSFKNAYSRRDAARYAKRSGYGRKHGSNNLHHKFPCLTLHTHFLLSFSLIVQQTLIVTQPHVYALSPLPPVSVFSVFTSFLGSSATLQPSRNVRVRRPPADTFISG